VGYIDAERYVLGNTGQGIAPAVQKMVKLRREYPLGLLEPASAF
jgi:hypothetical protein